MHPIASRWLRRLLPLVIALCGGTLAPNAQSGAGRGEWRTYGGDLANTRYSPLAQINAETFGTLEVAWRFKTDHLGPQPEFDFQATPLMVDGVLYLTAGTRRAAVALDAGTGEMLWMHRLDEGRRGRLAPRPLSGRGLAYWSDGQDARILYVTPGYRLVALHAKTGVPIATFGRNGLVDLKQDIDQALDPDTADIGWQAAPIVSGDVILIGAAHSPGSRAKSITNAKGYVRAFDVRTGKRLWIFHTIPRPNEFGADTWEGDAASYTGNAGVWAQMSIDEELGLAYLPVELPSIDQYGGHRRGNALFGESLVAVDLRTGRRTWHFQLVHHGIWDMDIPCAPVLVDIVVDGRPIKAVAQPTKQGWVYVFDRVTGVPVWPIEERPVPQSDVPGERTSATQPFVTRPPAFDRQGVTVDDLIDFTPELRAEARVFVSNYKLGPMFTPAVVSTWPRPLGTLMLPNLTGGANWQGASYDPETHVMYIFSNTAISSTALVRPTPDQSDSNYISGSAQDPARAAPSAAANASSGAVSLTVQGLPIVKPPYGRITAIDLNKGEILWQVAHGETPDNIRNHPALKGLTIPRTGRQGRIGTLVTKTLVIAGEGGFFTAPDGRRGAMLRAYDKATGRDVGAVYLPAPQTGSPMTYLLNGRQHLTVSVGGGAYSGELIVFRVAS